MEKNGCSDDSSAGTSSLSSHDLCPSTHTSDHVKPLIPEVSFSAEDLQVNDFVPLHNVNTREIDSSITFNFQICKIATCYDLRKEFSSTSCVPRFLF